MEPHSTTPHEVAQQLAGESFPDQALNEADTRHRVVDTLIHEVLSWPRTATCCEKHIKPGYADYVLLGKRQQVLLVVEAKSQGVYFQLPPSFGTDLATRVPLETLLTDQKLSDAIKQVRTYCLKIGCEHASVTNGREWIFFKVFEKGYDWEKLKAFVIKDLTYFSQQFSEAAGNFGYSAIAERATLHSLLGLRSRAARDLFHAKEKIVGYSQQVESNRLSPLLRPLLLRYFSRMNEQDADFMDQCYVSVREHSRCYKDVEQLITDCLSPYFRNYNVKDFFDDSKGGSFGSRIASNVQGRRTREVVVLFGGKGAGKSTFIRRLLFHRPPHPIKHFALVSVIDLLECPEDKGRITQEIWQQLIVQLDKDKTLSGKRDALLALFRDRFELATNQDLVGLNKDSEEYNKQLNGLVREWLSDKEYCARCLADFWKRKQKGLVIVLDNTDQYSPPMQDFCFTLAQSISTALDCLVVVSMREERFFHSRIHGALDAFPGSGFHLTSPPARTVFQRRLDYVLGVLRDPKRYVAVVPDLTVQDAGRISRLFRVLRGEFVRRSSHLERLLKACAHGNMRMALDIFRDFLVSGYTRVDEMIDTPSWTLQSHQVLRPVMVPTKFFYDEETSVVPNVYRVRAPEGGSHFTAVRVLARVARNGGGANPVYVAVSDLKYQFATSFGYLDDFERTLDVFLRTGAVESNVRIDAYSEDVDAIRITPLGYYVLKDLCCMFSYLDLVCLDCGVHEERLARELAQLGEADLYHFHRMEKEARLDARLERVKRFIAYLTSEESKERESCVLGDLDIRLGERLENAFEVERKRILESAKRNLGGRRGRQRWVSREYWY